MTFPRPDGPPQFTAPWFKWFASRLTLPEGSPYRFEGHTLLMTEEFFRPELMHLVVVIPKSNQKTTWEAAIAVWHLLTIQAPRAYGGAADREQAKELYDFASHFVLSEPELEERLNVLDATLLIRQRNGRGWFKILASDDSKLRGKKQGKNITLGEIDELHAHENDSLITDFRSGIFKRRDALKLAGDPNWWQVGKLATITTAGYDRESALGELLVQFMGDPDKGIAPRGTVETDLRVEPDGSVVKDRTNGRLTVARFGDGRNVLLHWASRDSDDPNNFEQVKLANPASTVTVESLKDAKESLTPWAYERYRMNRWTLGFESWLPANAWSDLFSEAVPKVEHRTWEDQPESALRNYIETLYPRGTEIVAALDMARYADTAAIVTVAKVDPEEAHSLKVPRAIVWRTGGPHKPIRYEWVKAAARLLQATYDLRAFGFDDKYADQLGEELLDEGIPAEKFGQSDARIGPADTNLRREIIQGEFAHDGDPVLAAHVMACKARDVGPNLFKTVKQDGANPPPIDACKALSMANALSKVAMGSMYDDPQARI